MNVAHIARATLDHMEQKYLYLIHGDEDRLKYMRNANVALSVKFIENPNNRYSAPFSFVVNIISHHEKPSKFEVDGPDFKATVIKPVKCLEFPANSLNHTLESYKHTVYQSYGTDIKIPINSELFESYDSLYGISISARVEGFRDVVILHQLVTN